MHYTRDQVDIQTVEQARTALEAHLKKRVPPQHPTACAGAHKLRAAWVEERFRLESALRLAESASCRWTLVAQAEPEPAPEPIPAGSGAWQQPKPMSKRLEELAEAEAALKALEQGSEEYLRLRGSIYSMRRRIAKIRRAA